MAADWQLSGQKLGKNVSVNWGLDLETRILTISFAILSVSQKESDVKKTVAEVFGMPVYAPLAEFELPASVSAMQFITTNLAAVDRILSGQQAAIPFFR
ncbi:hypothetical protein A2572_03775 [Candidatus Collierbacteria bacterium RIFOXYD1_FULL_40_9]|uniref:Uncharacterized protein n=1 Tax=Candidatus Collierbacteria bacterium RIFOXYD1_FULL_40_9 TaxID=1817731 RepID=A0A1F5FU59_9BACT|nr:MAG: hypothetical protein A2572_03775 [Candidatus Collierbacteria bacterium RIFOXYD1_FULL_40_9]